MKYYEVRYLGGPVKCAGNQDRSASLIERSSFLLPCAPALLPILILATGFPSADFLLFPLLNRPLHLLVSLSPCPPFSHSILSNLWTTGFTSQHSGGLEVQDQGASRLNIWRGLPSAAASSGGRDTAALWGSSMKEGFRAHVNIFIGSFMRIKPSWSNHF